MSDIDKQKERRGYYRRIKYYRVQQERFNKQSRLTEPTCCLACGYNTCRCSEVDV